jgi:hypothetical protein
MHRLNNSVCTGILAACLCALLSCNIFSKVDAQRRNTVKPNDSPVFSEGSFALERSPDGKTLNVSFETPLASNCSIAAFPTLSPPGKGVGLAWNPCKSAQPGRIFLETLSDLDPVQLYTIAVRLWGPDKDFDSATEYRVQELPPPTAESPELNFKLDLVTLGGQVYARKNTLTITESVSSILTPLPCSFLSSFDDKKISGLPTEKTLDVLDKLPLTRVSSRGYLSGSTDLDATVSSYKNFSGSSLVPTGSDWIMTLQNGGASGSFRPQIPVRLSSAAIFVGSNKTELENSSLEDSDSPGPLLKGNESVRVSWDTTKVNDSPHMVTVSITSKLQGDTVLCRVPSNSKEVTIPGALLQKFSRGLGNLAVVVENIQAIESRKLVLHSYDWKSHNVRF